MFDAPEIVVGVHKDFITAGARVITVNNYTATPTRLNRHGYGDKFLAAHQLAIDLVERAIAEVQAEQGKKYDVNIAGCLPPSLRPAMFASAALNYRQSYDQYCQLIEAQASHVDLFLVETISNITEARAAISALKGAGQKSFIGLTLSDDLSNTLRSGESLARAIDMLGAEGIDGLCVNCSFPEVIDAPCPCWPHRACALAAMQTVLPLSRVLRPAQRSIICRRARIYPLLFMPDMRLAGQRQGPALLAAVARLALPISPFCITRYAQPAIALPSWFRPCSSHPPQGTTG